MSNNYTKRLLLLAAVPTVLATLHSSAPASPAPTSDAQATSTTGTPPASITLVGVVRDFRERSKPGGHPDFERQPARGFGHYCDNVQPTLSPNKKPVFQGGGFKVRSGYQWKNSAGKNICWRLYDLSLIHI